MFRREGKGGDCEAIGIGGCVCVWCGNELNKSNEELYSPRIISLHKIKKEPFRLSALFEMRQRKNDGNLMYFYILSTLMNLENGGGRFRNGRMFHFLLALEKCQNKILTEFWQFSVVFSSSYEKQYDSLTTL